MNESTHSLPKGFRAAGAYCGIKRNTSKKDISLVVADNDAVAVGVYTRNLVCAAPVVLDRQRTPGSNLRAVITNSGNANACTGEQGDADAAKMCELTAAALGCNPEQVLVMSTGIIGQPLPMDKIAAGIESAAAALGDNSQSLRDAADGILTTDTVEKMASRMVFLGDQEVTISGFSKGSGMIAPNMATMLGVVMTDARLDPQAAQTMMNAITDRTFNCISVDGHMSTNDTVVLLASGAVGQTPITGKDAAAFAVTLEEVCTELARKIVDDGEGATHLVEIHVRGSDSSADAFTIAKSIANSPLVKTAITGADPNWGRIVSAAGYAGPTFDPMQVSLKINDVELYRSGAPVAFDAEAVSKTMRENREVFIELTVGEGESESRFWTCDLTKEYITINADYHT